MQARRLRALAEAQFPVVRDGERQGPGEVQEVGVRGLDVLNETSTIPSSVPNTQFLIPTISLLCQVVSVRAPAATDGSPPRVRVASLVPRPSRPPMRIRRIRSRAICSVDRRRSVPLETQSARPPSRY